MLRNFFTRPASAGGLPETARHVSLPPLYSAFGIHAAMNTSALTCWVVTDGKVGMEIQAIGLAEALGIEPVVKRIAPACPGAGCRRRHSGPRSPPPDKAATVSTRPSPTS